MQEKECESQRMLRRALKHGLVDVTKVSWTHLYRIKPAKKYSSMDMARAHQVLARGTFAVDSCWEKVAICLCGCGHW